MAFYNLLAPSVCQLDAILKICEHEREHELTQLDMAINFKKSCCFRIRSLMTMACANICAMSGTQIPWVSELRYLGVYLSILRTD